jgi:hypothetical protein
VHSGCQACAFLSERYYTLRKAAQKKEISRYGFLCRPPHEGLGMDKQLAFMRSPRGVLLCVAGRPG